MLLINLDFLLLFVTTSNSLAKKKKKKKNRKKSFVFLFLAMHLSVTPAKLLHTFSKPTFVQKGKISSTTTLPKHYFVSWKCRCERHTLLKNSINFAKRGEEREKGAPFVSVTLRPASSRVTARRAAVNEFSRPGGIHPQESTGYIP